MAQYNEQLHNELKYLLKLDAKMDYSDRDMMRHAYAAVTRQKLFKSGDGKKYVYKLGRILDGKNDGKCVYCNHIPEKGIICDNCLARIRIGISEQERNKAAVEKRRLEFKQKQERRDAIRRTINSKKRNIMAVLIAFAGVVIVAAIVWGIIALNIYIHRGYKAQFSIKAVSDEVYLEAYEICVDEYAAELSLEEYDIIFGTAQENANVSVYTMYEGGMLRGELQLAHNNDGNLQAVIVYVYEDALDAPAKQFLEISRVAAIRAADQAISSDTARSMIISATVKYNNFILTEDDSDIYYLTDEYAYAYYPTLPGCKLYIVDRKTYDNNTALSK